MSLFYLPFEVRFSKQKQKRTGHNLEYITPFLVFLAMELLIYSGFGELPSIDYDCLRITVNNDI